MAKFGFITVFFTLFSVISTVAAHAGTVRIAVASNFTHTLRLLVADFETSSGHTTRVSSASTGKLYVQINNGAPFDIFLAADEERPDLLLTEGKASANFARIYASGKLVLLSNISPDGDCKNVLSSASLKRLSIANPATAPYGRAARQILQHLGLWDTLKPKLVMGENIAQTLQFVSTGSASAGFVARSMLPAGADTGQGCVWDDIPADMYDPINQKMVVLTTAADNPAVIDFWNYMQSDAALSIIRNHGYNVP